MFACTRFAGITTCSLPPTDQFLLFAHALFNTPLCTWHIVLRSGSFGNSYFNAATESGCLLNETQPVIIVLMWSVAQRQIFYFYHPFRVDSSKESLWPVLLRVHFWLTVYIQLQIGFQLKIHDFKFETFKVWCTWGTNN